MNEVRVHGIFTGLASWTRSAKKRKWVWLQESKNSPEFLSSNDCKCFTFSPIYMNTKLLGTKCLWPSWPPYPEDLADDKKYKWWPATLTVCLGDNGLCSRAHKVSTCQSQSAWGDSKVTSKCSSKFGLTVLVFGYPQRETRETMGETHSVVSQEEKLSVWII